MTFDAELDQFFQESKQSLPASKPQLVSFPTPPPKEEKKLPNRKIQEHRTVFIGNVNIEIFKDNKLQQKFKEFLSTIGKIEAIRYRSIPVEQAPSRKLAIVKKQFRSDLDSCNCYVVFESEDSVPIALERNGTVYMDKHLRFDRVDAKKDAGSGKKSIFIGNLPPDIKEEELWTLFASCGEIESVRIVRDGKTNQAKGVAFVNFAERSSVTLALKLNESTIRERTIRITRYLPEETRNDAKKGPVKRQSKGKSNPKGILKATRTGDKSRRQAESKVSRKQKADKKITKSERNKK